MYLLLSNFDEALKMTILIIFHNNKGKNTNLIFIFSSNHFKVLLMHHATLSSSFADCSDCKNCKTRDSLMRFLQYHPMLFRAVRLVFIRLIYIGDAR